jgi:hypothetical protein
VAPIASNVLVSDDWGKTCVVVTLAGSDPNGDPIEFKLMSKPSNGKLFIYDAGATDFLGAEVTTATESVPATLCYKTNNRFFFGSDIFKFIAVDPYGLQSPIASMQINIIET